MPPEVAESACIHLLTRLRHFWDSRCHVLHSLEILLTRLTALYSTFEVLGRRLACFCRSFFWWLGFIVFFRTRGCIVASALLACCALTGTAPLDIFGPTFVVYFLRGWTSRDRGAKSPGLLREYIGVTEKHEEERKNEHMGRAKSKGADWLQIVELEGNPVVLYETKSEAEALQVEMFAVLWRYRCRTRPYRESGFGGMVRGAWFLRCKLGKAELDFIALAFGETHGVDAMPVLLCFGDETPARLCIKGAVVEEAKKWLRSKAVQDRSPPDLEAHLQKKCFNCLSGAHLSRYCPLLFATPQAGRYIEPAVAAAVAPARPRRAAPGQGLQTNYHRNPAFGGTKLCGTPGAEHPGPCYFGAEDELDKCDNCGRGRICAAGNGSGRKRKFNKPKCATYPNCGPALPSGACQHCGRKVKRPRSTYN